MCELVIIRNNIVYISKVTDMVYLFQALDLYIYIFIYIYIYIYIYIIMAIFIGMLMKCIVIVETLVKIARRHIMP